MPSVPLGRPASRIIRAPFPSFAPRCTAACRARHPQMDGINWLDLFSSMDRFLEAIVNQNVVLVYVTLFAIFFSETGLVVMAFLPGDSLLFVSGAVAASPSAQAKGLNVHLLAFLITLAAVLGNTLNYHIGKWLGKKIYDGTIGWIDQAALHHDIGLNPGCREIRLTIEQQHPQQ